RCVVERQAAQPFLFLDAASPCDRFTQSRCVLCGIGVSDTPEIEEARVHPFTLEPLGVLDERSVGEVVLSGCESDANDAGVAELLRARMCLRRSDEDEPAEARLLGLHEIERDIAALRETDRDARLRRRAVCLCRSQCARDDGALREHVATPR